MLKQAQTQIISIPTVLNAPKTVTRQMVPRLISPKLKPPQTQLSITRPGSVTVPRTTCSTSKVSDKQNSRVSSSYILQCAIYPICPVFNARTGKLTAQASNAIKRIFNIADHNFNDVIEKVKTMSVL